MFDARVRGQARTTFSKIKNQRTKIKDLLSFLCIFTLYSFIFSLSVSAQYGQYGAYGGYGAPSPSESILIDKMVGKASVTTKGGSTQIDFVDNLSSSDTRFKPGQEVSFQLKVKNTADKTLEDVVVKDVLPAFVEPVSLGGGTYDQNSRTITINVGDLVSQAEKIYTIRVKIASQQNLPGDQSVICLINKAQAFAKNVSDEDSSQFCVEKEVLGVKTQPQAGPEMGLGLLALQMLGLAGGIYLRKQS